MATNPRTGHRTSPIAGDRDAHSISRNVRPEKPLRGGTAGEAAAGWDEDWSRRKSRGVVPSPRRCTRDCVPPTFHAFPLGWAGHSMATGLMGSSVAQCLPAGIASGPAKDDDAEGVDRSIGQGMTPCKTFSLCGHGSSVDSGGRGWDGGKCGQHRPSQVRFRNLDGRGRCRSLRRRRLAAAAASASRQNQRKRQSPSTSRWMSKRRHPSPLLQTGIWRRRAVRRVRSTWRTDR